MAGFETFTDRSRKVLQLARVTSEELGHTYVGTEHLLIGLCREGGGVASHVLKGLGITPERIVVETRRILGVDPPDGLPHRLDAVLHGLRVGTFVWENGVWKYEAGDGKS